MNIDESIHKEWFLWIHKHIQDVLASGFFVSAKLTQVLVEEEMGGVTYSVQYTAKSKDSLARCYKEDAPKLREEAGRFGDKVLSFRTELEIITEQTEFKPQ